MGNKHEEAKQCLIRLKKMFGTEYSVDLAYLLEHHKEFKATEKRLEDLERDVKLLFDSIEFTFDGVASHTELGKLIDRLKK